MKAQMNAPSLPPPPWKKDSKSLTALVEGKITFVLIGLNPVLSRLEHAQQNLKLVFF